nr:hypothetical protein GCM10020093_001140 [Planobispora longispora]
MLSAADGPAPRILSVSGRAGVGKTTLAVHLAHRLRGAYPDGQLYADFSAPHTTPDEVLGQFLRALGLPAPRCRAVSPNASSATGASWPAAGC